MEQLNLDLPEQEVIQNLERGLNERLAAIYKDNELGDDLESGRRTALRLSASTEPIIVDGAETWPIFERAGLEEGIEGYSVEDAAAVYNRIRDIARMYVQRKGTGATLAVSSVWDMCGSIAAAVFKEDPSMPVVHDCIFPVDGETAEDALLGRDHEFFRVFRDKKRWKFAWNRVKRYFRAMYKENDDTFSFRYIAPHDTKLIRAMEKTYEQRNLYILRYSDKFNGADVLLIDGSAISCVEETLFTPDAECINNTFTCKSVFMISIL